MFVGIKLKQICGSKISFNIVFVVFIQNIGLWLKCKITAQTAEEQTKRLWDHILFWIVAHNNKTKFKIISSLFFLDGYLYPKILTSWRF